MKKQFLILVLLFCLLSSLCACGGDSISVSVNPSTNDAPEAFEDSGQYGSSTPEISDDSSGLSFDLFASADYEYEVLNDGTAMITKYTGEGGDLLLPSVIDGHTVTQIGEYVLPLTNSINSVTIPETVTKICNNAFTYGSFTSVSIPNSVTTIGCNAFDGCGLLSSIEIPDSVSIIENATFFNCYSLTSVTIPGSVTTIKGGAFGNCYSLVSVTIQDGVVELGSEVFNNCDNLTSIELPNSLQSIGAFAFSDCGLTSLIVPDSVTSIGSGIFYGCEHLESVTIPESVTSLGNQMFNFCNNLTIRCRAGSVIEQYAIDNRLKYENY